MAEINREDWQAALNDVMGPPPDQDAVTRAEFQEMLGVGRAAAVNRLKLLVEGGKAAPTTKMVMVGNVRRVLPAFRLLKPEPPAKGKKR